MASAWLRSRRAVYGVFASKNTSHLDGGGCRAHAEPGQIAQLYKMIVAAGNAVREGESAVHRKTVVSGYLGESALILQVLGMLRVALRAAMDVSMVAHASTCL